MKHKFEYNDGGRANYFAPKAYRVDYTGDCVIRSIAIATNLDYKIVWDDLFNRGRDLGKFPNDVLVYEPYLQFLGWRKEKPMRKGKKLYKLNTVPLTDGYYIVGTNKHLSCIGNGKILDIADCGWAAAYSYWTNKPKTK